jgi:hypothetical protein
MPRRRRELSTYSEIATLLGKHGIGVYGPAPVISGDQPTSYRWECGCAAIAGEDRTKFLWVTCNPHDGLRP